MEAEMLLMYSYSDPHDVLTLIVRLTVLVAVVLTVPLTHFPVTKFLFLINPTILQINLKIFLKILYRLKIIHIYFPGKKSFDFFAFSKQRL